MDKYLFTGKEFDPQTGYYYFGARYYEPKIARWLSVDPAIDEYLPEVGACKSDLLGYGGVFNHTNLNFYHYAKNNPIVYYDPNGKWFWAILPGLVTGGINLYKNIENGETLKALEH